LTMGEGLRSRQPRKIFNSALHARCKTHHPIRKCPEGLDLAASQFFCGS
jgi:hypothetical protein